MRRLQLFEFEDLPWFPSAVREAMTDFLTFIGNVSDKPFVAFAERLEAALEQTGDEALVDLASGGGGPALTLARLMNQRRERALHVTLTDLYPNLPRLELAKREGRGAVDFVSEPVDATRVPDRLKGFRLICNAFHHLSPDAARRCLMDAVEARQGIAVVEMAQRSASAMAGISVGVGAMLVMTPMIRPRSVSRFALTYLLPVVPVCTLWDGLVSCLRAYEPEELHQLVNSLPPNGYTWEIGRVPASKVATLTYLIGHPKAEVREATVAAE